MISKLFDTNITSHTIQDYPYELLWSEDLGIGYLKSDGYDYGEDYWQKYQTYVNDLGTQLTLARADFIKKNVHSFDDLCDVGIGSGQFVDTVKCKGYDINSFACEWLKSHGYYADVNTEPFKTLSLWDVIEHIDNPSDLLAKTENMFISTPIYQDIDDCLASKHLRPGEHIWYFTDVGIKNFMSLFGFELIAEDDFETVLGRESILSYFFQKIYS